MDKSNENDNDTVCVNICTVDLTKCDDECARQLRNRSDLNKKQKESSSNLPQTTHNVPAKRSRHLISTPSTNVTDHEKSDAAPATAVKGRAKSKAASATVVKDHEKSGAAPAKRGRRLNSTPSEAVKERQQSDNVPSKRNRRLDSLPVAPRPSTDENVDRTLLSAVEMNCKLTNEILQTKEKLSGKCEALLKMQKDFYEKDIECMNLKDIIAGKDIEIKQLKDCIEAMRAEKFCDDLIEFDKDCNTTTACELEDNGPVTPLDKSAAKVVNKSGTNVANANFNWTPTE